MVDVDPVKSITDESASDAERDCAIATADRVRGYLADRGFPTPMVVDSGNGRHLLYRCDLDNNSLSQVLISGFLKALAVRFDDPTRATIRQVGSQRKPPGPVAWNVGAEGDASARVAAASTLSPGVRTRDPGGTGRPGDRGPA